MKKFIRIFDCVLAVILTAVYCLVIFGSFALPNNAVTYNLESVSYKNIYVPHSTSDTAVDYQNDKSVSSAQSDIRLFGIIPVKDVTVSRQEKKDGLCQR
ncbi:MAG: hypothetical protein LUG95_01935 [Clostridiales bacterium]|nr:hypothetical protein [Clostridiales bacterium]